MSYYYIRLLFLTKTKNYYIMSQYIINRSTKLCVSRVCVCVCVCVISLALEDGELRGLK